jgi:membrane protease subunit HflK
VGTSLAVLFAVHIKPEEKTEDQTKSPTRNYLRKNLQTVVALCIGLFLLWVSLSIFLQAFAPIKMDLAYPVPAALAMLALALFSLLLSRLEAKVGGQESATALVADSHHSKVDMLVSILVAAALMGEGLGLALDRAAALLIAGFVFLEACHVLVLVYRQTRNGRTPLEHPYPDWLQKFLLNRLPGLKNRICRAIWGTGTPSPKSMARAGKIAMAAAIWLVVCAYLASGVFLVQAGEMAIVERFGRPLQKAHPLGPGIYYSLPWPIDQVRKIDALRVRRMVVGTEVSDQSPMFLWTNVHYIREFNLLTGENIFADTGIILNYRIKDPFAFLYTADRPEENLREISQGVLLRKMAQAKFFDLVTTGRDELEKSLNQGIETQLKETPLGIELLSVNLRDIHPPTNVAAAFEEVVGAAVDYETYINQARGYKSDLIPQARGQAAIRLKQAHSAAEKLIRKSRGESSRFLNNQAQYRQNPQVEKKRLLLETMEGCLSGKDKFILPSGEAGNVELFMTESPPGQIPGLGTVTENPANRPKGLNLDELEG